MTRPDGASQPQSSAPRADSLGTWMKGPQQHRQRILMSPTSGTWLTLAKLTANTEHPTGHLQWPMMNPQNAPQSLRRPTCHLVGSWLRRPHSPWSLSHRNKHVLWVWACLPPVLSQHSHPPRSSFKGPAAQLSREQTAYSHRLLQSQLLL